MLETQYPLFISKVPLFPTNVIICYNNGQLPNSCNTNQLPLHDFNMCPKSVHSCYVSSGSTLLVFTSSVSACESIVRFACSRLCAGTTTASNSDPNHVFFLPLFSCCCCQLWRQGVCQISGKCHGHLLCTLPLEPLEGQTTAMEPVTWNPTAIRVEGLEAAVQAIANNWMPNIFSPIKLCERAECTKSIARTKREKTK